MRQNNEAGEVERETEREGGREVERGPVQERGLQGEEEEGVRKSYEK